MAITFPREIPAVGYVTADFLLRDPVKASPSGARLVNYTQVTDPAWEASLVTRPLSCESSPGFWPYITYRRHRQLWRLCAQEHVLSRDQEKPTGRNSNCLPRTCFHGCW